MSKLTQWMDRKLYPCYGHNWDNDLFRKVIQERLQPDFICLDYGAGRGNVAQMNFKGKVEFVAGVDPGEEVFENPYLDEAKQIDVATNHVPYEDDTFDLIFSNSVMEHVQSPELVFRELARVLKPGGSLLFKTPNKWHYMPMIARMTPTWFHEYYNKRRGRAEEDTFPTVYQCNSKSQVRKHAASAGLEVSKLRIVEGRPEYLRLAAIPYFCGYLYERTVNLTGLLSSLRCVLIAELKKP